MRHLSWRHAPAPVAALFLGALLCLIPSRAEAGAWTRKQGEFYLQLGYTYARATSSYNVDTTLYRWQTDSAMPLPGAFQREHAFVFYGEYGVLDSLTLVVSWDAKSLFRDLGPDATIDPTDSSAGIGEVRVGLRGRIIREPLVLSMEMIVGIPAQAAPLNARQFNPQQTLPLGIGTTHATAWLHLGKSWSEHFSAALERYWSLFTNVAVGFQYRTNFLSNFVFNLEVGNVFFSHAYVGFRYFGEVNVGEPFVQPGVAGGPDVLFGLTDQQRWAVAVGFVYTSLFNAVVEYSAPTGGSNSVAFRRIGVSLATSY